MGQDLDRARGRARGGSPRLRVLFVYQSASLPSSRIRIVQMAPHLENEGLHAELFEYPRSLLQKRRLLSSLSRADVVVLQKKLPSWSDHRLIWSRCPIPVVFDFDDAIPFRDQPKNQSYESKTRTRRFSRIVRTASGLVAGNAYLASLPSLARETLILPSPVPHEGPLKDVRASNERLRIGWVGLGRNLTLLEPMEDVLLRLGSQHSIELTVVSDQPYRLARVSGQAASFELRNISWSLEAQEAWLARFDIGIMPLGEENPWNQGKCSYKLLQYMSAGLPVVASDVGMNREVVSSEAGFLVSSPGDWIAALDRLLRDPVLRAQMGARGRAIVEATYTYPVQARRLAAFLKKLAGQKAP